MFTKFLINRGIYSLKSVEIQSPVWDTPETEKNVQLPKSELVGGYERKISKKEGMIYANVWAQNISRIAGYDIYAIFKHGTDSLIRMFYSEQSIGSHGQHPHIWAVDLNKSAFFQKDIEAYDVSDRLKKSSPEYVSSLVLSKNNWVHLNIDENVINPLYEMMQSRESLNKRIDEGYGQDINEPIKVAAEYQIYDHWLPKLTKSGQPQIVDSKKMTTDGKKIFELTVNTNKKGTQTFYFDYSDILF